ncbi:unnamed protein product [Polarella glacialis]|uniref:tRNA (uracil-O(2)-)-methyltransferase n=1 Tax=Polarella glacialis TaxID=89957 RepID=A0A813HS10_POLGL|nr:unnamed protein product [Polarella glacialis]CAE8739454.1 unnamed protein product [Polarella glacialis]
MLPVEAEEDSNGFRHRAESEAVRITVQGVAIPPIPPIPLIPLSPPLPGNTPHASMTDLVTVAHERSRARKKALRRKYYPRWETLWPDTPHKERMLADDFAIAAFLLELFELAQKPRFVEVGCGNGFLTYLLSQEGAVGRGLDMAPRDFWAALDGADLEKAELPLTDSGSISYSDHTQGWQCDWVLANHPDELTPYVAGLAAACSASFVTIPCCQWDFGGARFSRKCGLKSQYASYLDYIEQVADRAGFEYARCSLSISSSKNVAIVGTLEPLVGC